MSGQICDDNEAAPQSSKNMNLQKASGFSPPETPDSELPRRCGGGLSMRDGWFEKPHAVPGTELDIPSCGVHALNHLKSSGIAVEFRVSDRDQKS